MFQSAISPGTGNTGTPDRGDVVPNVVLEVLNLYSEYTAGGHRMWRGTVARGYPLICRLGQNWNAARLVFWLKTGTYPREVRRTCKLRLCIAAEHLEAA